MQSSETPIDSLYKWERKGIDIQDVKINGDTLSFFSAGWFFYYPLGKFSSIDSIESKYPFFKFRTQMDTAVSNPIKLYKLSFNGSFIKFLKNEDTKRMEVVYSRINDGEIILVNGFKVGLRKEMFFSYFFRHPINLGRIRCVKVYSILDGMIHSYYFDNDLLSSIIMDTDYDVYKF